MKIRKAEKKDIPRILALLGQVLQIHAEIRPDIFIPGTTKYTPYELAELLEQEDHPIYVAVDEDDLCMGYAFCQLREQPFSTNMVPFKSLFIDDLCVDKQTRGQHIGESLFEYVKQQAKELGCYEVTLNVWAGNTSAERFYEKMGMKTKGKYVITGTLYFNKCRPLGGTFYFFSLVRNPSGNSSDHGRSRFRSSGFGKGPILRSSSNT